MLPSRVMIASERPSAKYSSSGDPRFSNGSTASIFRSAGTSAPPAARWCGQSAYPATPPASNTPTAAKAMRLRTSARRSGRSNTGGTVTAVRLVVSTTSPPGVARGATRGTRPLFAVSLCRPSISARTSDAGSAPRSARTNASCACPCSIALARSPAVSRAVIRPSAARELSGSSSERRRHHPTASRTSPRAVASAAIDSRAPQARSSSRARSASAQRSKSPAPST